MKKAPKAAKKPVKPAKRSSKPVMPMPEARPTQTRHSVTIEPIENGFLATHDISGPKVKGGYMTKKIFHPKMPPMPQLPGQPMPTPKGGKK